MILFAADTYADEFVQPNPVLMTEQSLSKAQAQAAQKAWAEHLGLEVVIENAIGMKLRLIPPGSWRMSSPKAEEGQKGPVTVTLTQAFLIGQFEVTQGEWKRVMGPIETKLNAGAGDRFPVYGVNHAEATEFCQRLSLLDQEAGKLPDGYEYRLPTDAEWEFACRAGTLTLTHFGDRMSSQLANYDGSRPFRDSEKGPNLGRTAEVGSYPANAWGLHNMHGNVSEWCLDWYQHKVKGGIDPVQLQPADWEKPPMVVRPNSWGNPGRYGHSASRYHSPPTSRNSHIGFRPVLAKIIPVATAQADSAEPAPVEMTNRALSATQALTAQKTWADHLGVDAIFDNSLGMQLCVIPPGTFPMGDDYGKGWKGRREVKLSQPYFIGRYEVTRGEWERVMGSFHGQPKVGAGDRFPRNGVDYAEAAEFCRKLTGLEREDGELPKGYEYRLPTSAELEYASRAGTLTLTYFGDKLSSRQANFDGSQPLNGAEEGPNLGRAAEVGSYPANAWGLHDTLGNVAEWCVDWYHAELKGGLDPVQWLPPPERPIPQRVVRGGYHSRSGGYCRSANRYRRLPEDGSNLYGFRVVLSKQHLEGLHELTDSRHTDFNQAWTRDGTNWRIWNRRNSKADGYHVMSGNIDHIPGEKWAVAVTDQSYHTWAHTCLSDGRILVQSHPPKQKLGYYLMTPNEDEATKYESIQCELATKGVLDRISLSPSETKVCFEFQHGFEKDAPGRTLYVADFDATQRTITDARPFANEEGNPIWCAFPRWSQDESAIIYQVNESLYRYNLDKKSTTKVWTNGSADGRYPNIKRAPK